eukprot:jgi/Psemu1/8070/gm1.8070_g
MEAVTMTASTNTNNKVKATNTYYIKGKKEHLKTVEHPSPDPRRDPTKVDGMKLKIYKIKKERCLEWERYDAATLKN